MKGRLLTEQLVALNTNAKNVLNQLINNWAEQENVSSLLNDHLFNQLMSLLDNEQNIIMTDSHANYTYPHLVKIIEVMIWLKRNEESIKQSTNQPLKNILKATETILKDILTTTVQSKKFPKDEIVRGLDTYCQQIITDGKHVILKDNLADMILLAILNITNGTNPTTPEGVKLKKIIVQLLKNSRYKWNTSVGLHVREDAEGNTYESYEHTKTYLGLLAIIDLIYSDNTMANNEFHVLLNEYFKDMSTKTILPIDNKLDDKDKKDIEKGVVRNRHGKFSIANFQYCPVKNEKPSQASQDMQVALETIISNLYYRRKSTAYYNEKGECILVIAKKNNEKQCVNLTQLKRNQPLNHEINLSKELCRYASSAQTGSRLYLIKSSVDLEKIVKDDTIHPSSCVIVYAISISSEKKTTLSIKSIYYVDSRRKIEQIAENKPEIKDKMIQIIKNTALITEIEKTDIYHLEECQEKLFDQFHRLLAEDTILFLKKNFAISPSPVVMRHQAASAWPYSELPTIDVSSINVYTGHDYTRIQPAEREYATDVIPSNKDLIIGKYIDKFGDHNTNPHALYQIKIETHLYSHFSSHGLAKLIQAKQQRIFEKIEVNVDNCHLFIATNEKMVEDCRNTSQKQAIIILVSSERKEFKIYQCIDKKFVKKIMNDDLIIDITHEKFFHFVAEDKQTYLNNLLSINITDGLVKPTDERQKNIVNEVLRQAAWHCELNKFTTTFFRVDGESKMMWVKLKLMKKLIREYGCAFSFATEFFSSSLGVATQFLTKDGYQILTVIHAPNGFTPIIHPLSDTGCELEALFSSNSKTVYFKIESMSSFRGIILHAILTDYDFQLTHPDWKDFVSAQMMSELKANIKICRSSLSSIDTEILTEFKKIKSLVSTADDIQALSFIEKYFEQSSSEQSSSYSALVQKSCLEGTPLSILKIPHNQDKRIDVDVDVDAKIIRGYVEEYRRASNVTHTYVVVLIDTPKQTTLKIYYIKPDSSIITIRPNLTKTTESIISDIAMTLSSQKHHSSPDTSGKKYLKPHQTKELNRIISQANKADTLLNKLDTLPLLVGIKESLNTATLSPHTSPHRVTKRQKTASEGILRKFRSKINENLHQHAASKNYEEETPYQVLSEKIQRKLSLEKEVSMHEKILMHEKISEKNNVREKMKLRLPVAIESVQNTLDNLSHHAKKDIRSPKKPTSNNGDGQKPSLTSELDTIAKLLRNNNENEIFPILNRVVESIIAYININEKKNSISIEKDVDVLIFLHLADTIYSTFPPNKTGQMKSMKNDLTSLINSYSLNTVNIYLKQLHCAPIQFNDSAILDTQGYNLTHLAVSKLHTLTEANIENYSTLLDNISSSSPLSRLALNQLDDKIADFIKIKKLNNLADIKKLISEIQIDFKRIEDTSFTSREEYNIYKNLLNGFIAWTNQTCSGDKEIPLIEEKLILPKAHSTPEHDLLTLDKMGIHTSPSLHKREKLVQRKSVGYKGSKSFIPRIRNDKKNGLAITPEETMADTTNNNIKTDVSQAQPILINHGIDHLSSSLKTAILDKNDQQVRMILEDNTPDNDNQMTQLLKSKDPAGQTALHHAVMMQGTTVENEQKRIILKSLLFYHAKKNISVRDPDIKNNQGQTPFTLANTQDRAGEELIEFMCTKYGRYSGGIKKDSTYKPGELKKKTPK